MSANTDTKTIEGEILSEQPTAQLPATTGGEDKRDAKFSDVLSQRMDDIAPMLPRHISRERFMAAANAMVRQNPELLECTQRSIFNALTQAAQDGLLPDAREGVILPYYDKDLKAKVAKWNPMAYGMRKRAKELDDIIVDTQVVHDKDEFIWHQGDDPKLIHIPPKFGGDRGPMIGVYAIFKRDGVILHREVMSRQQVMDVKEKSKQPNSLMWTKFETEGWRKTALRRGMKTVPVSEDLERLLTRGDDDFDFIKQEKTPAPIAPSAPPAPIAPPAPAAPAAPSAPAAPAPSAPAAPAAEAPKDGVGEIPAFLDRTKTAEAEKAPAQPEVATNVMEDAAPHNIKVTLLRGKPAWVAWGKEFIERILASVAFAEMDKWRELNGGNLMECERVAPKAYASVQKAIAKRAGEIATQQPLTVPPSDVAAEDGEDAYGDLKREFWNELDACTSEVAVEELRDRVLPQLEDDDKEPWKRACADKATEIFAGPPRTQEQD